MAEKKKKFNYADGWHPTGPGGKLQYWEKGKLKTPGTNAWRLLTGIAKEANELLVKPAGMIATDVKHGLKDALSIGQYSDQVRNGKRLTINQVKAENLRNQNLVGNEGGLVRHLSQLNRMDGRSIWNLQPPQTGEVEPTNQATQTSNSTRLGKLTIGLDGEIDPAWQRALGMEVGQTVNGQNFVPTTYDKGGANQAYANTETGSVKTQELPNNTKSKELSGKEKWLKDTAKSPAALAGIDENIRWEAYQKNQDFQKHRKAGTLAEFARKYPNSETAKQLKNRLKIVSPLDLE